MKNKLKVLEANMLIALSAFPVTLLAEGEGEEYPYRTYKQFQSKYGTSGFGKAFGSVANVAFQGILVLIALNIILGVAALVVSGAKLGVSTSGSSRSEAQTSLLKQAIVFGLIGITPLAFMMIASIMSM